MALNEVIVNAMADLEEEILFAEVQKEMDAGTPALAICESLQKGMTIVGDRFAEKEYFLSELMLSAQVFCECQNLLGGEEVVESKYGTFVMGTVYGDIHDIGKNIVISVMRSNGFKVVDLGVDVRPEAYVEAIIEHDPKVVGFSCLLTTAFNAMRDCIQQVRAAGLDKGRVLLIGGGPCESSTVKYVGADDLCITPQDTVEKSIAFVTGG